MSVNRKWLAPFPVTTGREMLDFSSPPTLGQVGLVLQPEKGPLGLQLPLLKIV